MRGGSTDFNRFSPGVVLFNQFNPDQHLFAVQGAGDKNGEALKPAHPFTLMSIALYIHNHFLSNLNRSQLHYHTCSPTLILILE